MMIKVQANDSVEIYVKIDPVRKKEEIKCDNIIEQSKND